MNEWGFGAMVYCFCGVLVCFLSDSWTRRYLDPHEDKHLFLNYLTVVTGWPIFVLIVLSNWDNN